MSEPEPVVFGSLEPEPVVFGSLEPEPEPLETKTRRRSRSRSRLEKKSEAGAAKELVGSSALLEDKKHHKEIVLFLLFCR